MWEKLSDAVYKAAKENNMNLKNLYKKPDISKIYL